jgi:exopolyphosphatase/guanosine-5'-triphosphate,3'-diphosphate pyrophosphatase
MRVGVVDCGTNSIRLLIADIEGNNFREVTRQMQVDIRIYIQRN